MKNKKQKLLPLLGLLSTVAISAGTASALPVVGGVPVAGGLVDTGALGGGAAALEPVLGQLSGLPVVGDQLGSLPALPGGDPLGALPGLGGDPLGALPGLPGLPGGGGGANPLQPVIDQLTAIANGGVSTDVTPIVGAVEHAATVDAVAVAGNVQNLANDLSSADPAAIQGGAMAVVDAVNHTAGHLRHTLSTNPNPVQPVMTILP